MKMLASPDTFGINWSCSCTSYFIKSVCDDLEQTREKMISDDFIKIKRRCERFRRCYINHVKNLHTRYKIYKYSLGQEGNLDRTRCRPTRRTTKEGQHDEKTEFIKSDPCLATLNLGNIEKIQSYENNTENPEINKELTKTYLHNEIPAVNLLHKTSVQIRREILLLVSSMNTLRHPSLNNNYLPVQQSNNPLNGTKTPIAVQLPKLEYSKSSFCTLLGPFLEKLSSMEQITKNRQEADKDKRKSSFSTLKFLFGPYAQSQLVYNVIEQTNAQMKEKGTSQQFKQKSQGIGSGSIIGNDSSSESSKRRTIRIESGCSFSVSFIDRGKGASTATVSEVSSSQEPVPEPTKKKGKEKKELHRCLCTLSFPTDDKKLKNKPCDSGVCEPGKCTPSECFKRLQEKYGSKKKKSTSDVSSSQASQTSKKKERAGKETLVKEKGSSSISKYKETVEVKPLPKEEEKEKFNVVKCMTDCCNKFQFWKKDKPIELKPAVIGTDISVKDDKEKTFGSSAASQAGKKTDLKATAKDVKAAEGGEGDKKAKGKKAKGKKETGKEVTTETKGKKGEKKGEKKEEVQTDKKKAGKKKTDKKPTGEEVKKETKGTDKTTKTGRPLKPYECEPGICTPKVCVPKECYERKFPPPPPKTVARQSAFQECLRKLCCKKPIGEEKPGGVSAATQSRKSTAAPEIAPGTTVYKETGQVAKPKKGDKQAIDAGAPVEGGDVPTESRKTRKSTAYSGVQYFQSIDNEAMTQRQGVNIGSECSCSVEFYKMLF